MENRTLILDQDAAILVQAPIQHQPAHVNTRPTHMRTIQRGNDTVAHANNKYLGLNANELIAPRNSTVCTCSPVSTSAYLVWFSHMSYYDSTFRSKELKKGCAERMHTISMRKSSEPVARY
jgi:hypothetical protein